MTMVETETIDLEEDENIITIALNRPEKLNAISEEMMNGLYSTWENLEKNPEKAVLITGRGRATCSGADTSILEDDNFSPSESEYEQKQQEIFQMIQAYPRPTVMACKGATIGAAFIFAMECDFAVLGNETTFQYPETQLGTFSDRLPKLLSHLYGAQIAREVVLKGEAIDPNHANELGLVTDVVPEDKVDATANNLTEEISEYNNKVVELINDTLKFEDDPDEHVGYP